MNKQQNQKDASALQDIEQEIEALNREMRDLLQQKEVCMRRKKELMNAEDPRRRIFHHQQIHSLQMECLRLEVEAETKRRKINRLRLGMD